MDFKKGKKEFFCHDNHSMASEMTKKFFLTLIGILLVYALVLLATMIRNNLQEFYFIGRADRQERTITIAAVGKVTAKPDIAQTTMGMTSLGDTVSEAQAVNTKVINILIARLKELGVEEKDMQTNNYNIYPQYEYTEDEGRVLKGYNVSQNLVIKIRDLTKVNQVIGLAGEVEVNNVSGLTFTIDDAQVYKDQAREKAIKNIIAKATKLSRSLGVKFLSIVSYNEYESGGDVPYPALEFRTLGVGGAGPALEIESGSEDVILNVNVVFEIK